MYEPGEYPHDWRTLPDLADRIEARDWEVLLVYDACRWDAFEELCREAEPVATFAEGATPAFAAWWATHDGFDDITYVSGTPRTSSIDRLDEVEDGTLLSDSVGAYVEAFRDNTAVTGGDEEIAVDGRADSAWDPRLGTTWPYQLTDIAMRFEPPLVVHYLQPHTPFVGGITFDFQRAPSDTPLETGDAPSIPGSGEYEAAYAGHVSTDLIRAAYLENLRLVHRASRPLRREYDAVVTADHGEQLGPDGYGHGTRMDVGRVVPWAEYF